MADAPAAATWTKAWRTSWIGPSGDKWVLVSISRTGQNFVTETWQRVDEPDVVIAIDKEVHATAAAAGAPDDQSRWNTRDRGTGLPLRVPPSRPAASPH